MLSTFKLSIYCFFIIVITLTLDAVGSPLYKYDVISRVGDNDNKNGFIISFLPESISINSDGIVAFSSFLQYSDGSSGQSLHTNSIGNTPVRISPEETASTRVYSNGLQINNSGHIISRSRFSGTSLIRIWDASTPGVPIYTVAGGSSNGSHAYSSVFSHPTISNVSTGGNIPFVAFSTLDTSKSFPDTALVTPDVLGNNERSNYYESWMDIPIRPRIADDGTLINRDIGINGTQFVTIRDNQLNYNLNSNDVLAQTGGGTLENHGVVTSLGSSPGISDSGKVSAFYAETENNRKGIFLSIFNLVDQDKWSNSVAIAGYELPIGESIIFSNGIEIEGHIFFEDFQPNSRIGVLHQELGKPGLIDDTIVLAFIAKPSISSSEQFFVPGRQFSDKMGLWTIQIDLIDSNLDGLIEIKKHLPIPVAQNGDNLYNLTGDSRFENSDDVVESIVLNDPISSIANLVTNPENLNLSPESLLAIEAGSHNLAFLVTTSYGEEIILFAQQKNSCNLPVRRYPQGNENTGNPWGAHKLDNHCKNKTIGQIGCVLTTFTMQVNSISQKLNHLYNINPLQVNNFLIRSDDTVAEILSTDKLAGFTSGSCEYPNTEDNGGEFIRPNATTLFRNYFIPGKPPVTWKNLSINNPEPTLSPQVREAVVNAICGADKAPVAFRVPGVTEGNQGGHDVLLTGFTDGTVGGGKFLIADPAQGCGVSCRDGLLANKAIELYDYKPEYKAIGYIKDPIDLSYINISSSSDIEILFSESSGLSSGFMGGSGNIYINQIPNSFVSISSPNDDVPEEPVAEGEIPMREIHVETPPSDVYRVEIRGLSDNFFNISLSDVRPDGTTGSGTKNLIGYASSTNSVIYQFSYSPVGTNAVELIETVIPDLIGLDIELAVRALNDSGLNIGSITYEYSGSTANTVLNQSLAAGTSAAPDSVVDVTISATSDVIVLPNIVGLSQGDAETTLIGLRLTLGEITTEPSETVPAGYVIRQDPSENSTVEIGSAVSIVVSSGPELIIVPSLVGLSHGDAETTLIGLGLTLGALTTEPSETVPAGYVIRQDPSENSTVEIGSTVSIVVSSGPELIVVPNLVGLTQSAAETAIVNAGLTVGAITTANSDTVPVGHVISHNPAAGESVAVNSVVDLLVSIGVHVVNGAYTFDYWKNHLDEWPVENIYIADHIYTKEDALEIMLTPPKGDMSYIMFRVLIAAKLNVYNNAESSCINDTIVASDAWLSTYQVGSEVGGAGTSSPWRQGDPLAKKLDQFNNGLLCSDLASE